MRHEDTEHPGHDKSGRPKRRTVYDQHGTAHILTGMLGEGGQGIVCTTERPNVLVKVQRQRLDPQALRERVRQINALLNLELDGLHIARPQALIERPVPGYVMELMDGLEPLQRMLEKSHLALIEGEGLDGYVATGGLGRRLALLRELARTLAGLHARGLAYGDLSPANVFVSQSVGHHQLWLIDCDNLCVSERAGHGHVHTPGYGAPEVVRGESGVNSLSDAWAFAVIAFELLTHAHPFKGMQVEDGEPEEEDRALRGELPWVLHPEAGDNALAEPRLAGYVLTPALLALFTACFDAGRDDPGTRPSPAAWADALDAAVAQTLTCTECASSFHWNEAQEVQCCPFCDHEQALTLRLTHAWHCPEDFPDDPYLDSGDALVLGAQQPVTLHLAPVGTRHYHEAPAVCELRLADDGLYIQPLGAGVPELVRPEDDRHVRFAFEKRLAAEKRRAIPLALHLSHPDAPDLRPVWRFTW
ncbi:MAG: protein kinase [Proteobacteria bacterium]|nr:protein kinase [Pseudomonadota bacterium]